MERIDASTLELQERVVFINRVSKTVKGGRIYKFSALCVVGDGNGLVTEECTGHSTYKDQGDKDRTGSEDRRKHGGCNIARSS